METREIKFRALDEITLDWVFGTPVKDSDIKGRSYIAYGCTDGIDKIIVVKETIGQWTGLLDKNGIEVYEGDILRDGKGGNGVVIYSDPQFVVQVGNEIYSLAEGKVNVERLEYTEVVGDIYSNAELLTK